MATDVSRIVEALAGLYDFAGRVVVAVGAGGGQLIEYARPAQRVIAIDRDAAASERLATRTRELGLAERVEVQTGDFFDLRPRGDVLLFEFCLHEMPDPDRALARAAELAAEVLVLDHAPGSRWMWYAAEDGDVERGWKAVERRAVRRRRDVEALQHFDDFAALEARLAECGPVSRERIAGLRGRAGVTIPMPYRLALL